MNYLNLLLAKRNYAIALGIFILLSLWLLSGVLAGKPTAGDGVDDSARAAEAQVLTKVRARQIQHQQYPMNVLVRGRTEANRSVQLRAEISGQVVNVAVEKGQAVTKGQPLCELAKEDREYRLREARAAVKKAQLDYDGAQRLKTGGYQSRTAIAAAGAALEKAKANFKRRELDVANLAIKAAFDGVVDDRLVEVGDFMRPGDICMTLLELNPLLLVAQVSENDVAGITLGAQVSASLVTGERIEGRVRFVGRSADSVTRTFRMEVEADNPELLYRSGVTAEIAVPLGSVAAHLIPSSLLALDDAGKLGVRTLDSDHKVVFNNIAIVGDADDGVWVTGLSEQALLITVGQEYVSEGEKVAVVMEDNTAMRAAL